MRFSTRAIRVGQNPDSDFGAVIPPIHQSATFAWRDLDSIPPHDYTRVSNPTRESLEQVIASLEGARHAVAFSSGMAAILATFTLLQDGDHLLVASDIYGGTARLRTKLLPRQGILSSEFSALDPSTIAKSATPNTRMLIFETPTNPTLKVADIRSIALECKRLGILCVVDNTFASPLLQNPIELGVDIVVHSTTKYISGHSDVIGGMVVLNDDGLRERVFEYNKMVGAVPSPFDCWLSLRGVKTLELRMQRHCSNAQLIAELLATHQAVERVYFPGLPDDPGFALASSQMSGFGGMVSFEVRGGLAESTKVFMLAESLGGVESILGYPWLMSHGCLPEAERIQMGVGPSLIRLSVGIEDPQDLIEDLSQALDRAIAPVDSRSRAVAAV